MGFSSFPPDPRSPSPSAAADANPTTTTASNRPFTSPPPKMRGARVSNFSKKNPSSTLLSPSSTSHPTPIASTLGGVSVPDPALRVSSPFGSAVSACTVASSPSSVSNCHGHKNLRDQDVIAIVGYRKDEESVENSPTQL